MSTSNEVSIEKAEFILASTSPRRRELLSEAGYRFAIVAPDVDEESFDKAGMSPAIHAEMLALEKARNVAQKYPGKLVLGADTVVDFKGEIIGKAKDEADAERITRMLFSEPHEVVTGVALCRAGHAKPNSKSTLLQKTQKGATPVVQNLEIVRSVSTIIYPRKMTEEQIIGHVSGQSWKGKAGAYGIQETGDEFVERIEGSFTNVVGLPMELVRELLSKHCP